MPGDLDAEQDAFVHDLTTGTTACFTRTLDGQDGAGGAPSLSGDGEHVAFVSDHPGLVANDTNMDVDVFVRGYGASTRNAGSNPASYTAARPVLGETWRATVDVSTTGHTHAVLLGTTAPANLALGGGQRLLVDGPKVFELPLKAGPVATWTATLPSNVSLLGKSAFTQAAHLGGLVPFALSNAQDICLGC